jgi:hypothetical protein
MIGGRAGTSPAMRALRAGYGTVLLLAPGLALRWVRSAQAHGAGALAIRALGARQLAQAAVAAEASRAGAAVDAVHALSMVCLAACVPGARRAAGASALVSSALATNALRELRR